MSRVANLVLLCALVALAGLIAISDGQDVNWDLHNYHFYNPWAWVHGRTFGHDFLAAQMQTLFSPFLDLPFYAMVAANWDPRLITFVLAVPAGVGLYFLAQIVLLLFADLPPAERRIATIAAFAIGITGGLGRAMLGSTMNEWPGVMFGMAALWLLLRALAPDVTARIATRTLAAAGMIIGIGMGLKPTATALGVGLCAALLLRRPWRGQRVGTRLAETVTFGIAVTIGMALTYGYWGLTLWERFRNPVFPYFNQYIHSPWWPTVGVGRRTLGPHSLFEWLSLPFMLTGNKPAVVAEIPYNDWRIASVYILALVALPPLIWLRWFRSSSTTQDSPGAIGTSARATALFGFLGIFWVVALLYWAAQHSTARYIITLELLTGALIVCLLHRLVRRPSAAVATVVVAALLIATTTRPDWGHMAFGPRWFATSPPALKPGAMVVIATWEPVSWMIPFFREDARFVGINSNLVNPDRKSKLADFVAATVASHRGPLYVLTYPVDMGANALAYHQLAPIPGTCQLISANMPTQPVQLCELQRTGGGESK